MKDLLAAHPLRLQVLVPQAQSESGRRKLHILMQACDWFEELNLQLSFQVEKSPEIRRIIQAYFPFPVSIETNGFKNSQAEGLLVMDKPVFGKARTYYGCGLRLQQGEDILFETKRINSSAIHAVLQKALKIQTAWLKEQLAGRFSKD